MVYYSSSRVCGARVLPEGEGVHTGACEDAIMHTVASLRTGCLSRPWLKRLSQTFHRTSTGVHPVWSEAPLSSSWWIPCLPPPPPAVVQRAWQGVHLLRELEQGQLCPSAPPRKRKLQRVIKSVRATIVCRTWIAASRCLSRTRKIIRDYLQPSDTTCCSQDGDKGDRQKKSVCGTQHSTPTSLI